MRRDMDLVRQLLLLTESAQGALTTDALCVGLSRTEEEVAAHVELMVEAGLIQAEILRSMHTPVAAHIERLTWDGYEYLDAVRSDSVWSKVQTSLSDAAVSLPIDGLKTMAIAIAMRTMGF